VFNFYQINKNNEIRTCDHFVIKTDTILKKLIQLKKIKKLNKIIKYNLYYLGDTGGGWSCLLVVWYLNMQKEN